jgi:hypothetical protein
LTWDALQAIGEIAAAIGVLISVVYLAAQVRENAKRTAADTILRYTADVNTTRQALWASEEGARVYALAMRAEPIEHDLMRLRISLFWFSLFRSMEAAFLQYRAGNIPERVWTQYAAEYMVSVDSPGGRAALKAMGEEFLDPEFSTFVTTRLAAPDRVTLPSLAARWAEAREEEMDTGG